MNHSPRNRSLLWLLGAALVVLLAACGTAGTPQATLTVNVTGDGAVTSDPAGIDTTTADGDTTTFDEGTDVTLTATPDAGFQFDGWTGCDTATGTTCTLAMDADATVEATFVVATVPQTTLTVNVTGDGAVTSDPAGIDTTTADGDTTTFDEGTDVTLTATPDAGFQFDGWTGCDTATGTTCTLAMDADATVEAVFVVLPSYTLTVNVTGDGAVTSDPAGIDTTTAGGDTATFDEGTDVTLTATPDADFQIDSWTGCDTATDDTCTLAINADATIDATFTIAPGSLSIPITQGSDDAEELLNGSGTDPVTFPAGHTYTHSSDLEMTYDDGTNPGAQLVGLRFQDVTVPAGATITQASITFTANNDSAGAVTLVIAAQADVNPATFNDDADEDATSDLSTRALTTTTQSWTPGDWTGNLDYDTPDLSAIVQEIVDTAGWTSGNPIAFIIDGPEAAPLRRAFAYEYLSGQYAAVLNVDFE